MAGGRPAVEASATARAPGYEGAVTKLLYSATMSLDGFIAGPGGDMQWLAKHLAEPNPGFEILRG